MIGWLIGAVLAAEPACPDVEAELGILERSAALADVERAQEQAGIVVTGLACGRRVAPRTLARFWWAQAALLLALGADDAVDEALAAAGHADRDVRPDVYGASLHQRFDAALGRPAAGVGTIDAFPVPRGYVAAVDGEVRDLPADVAAGPHLLQIGPRRGLGAFADTVLVAPGIDVVVETGLPAALPRARRRPLLSGLGIGLGATGVALLSSTLATRDAARRAYADEAFGRGDAWVTVNHVSVVAGLLTVGAGGGLVIAGRW